MLFFGSICSFPQVMGQKQTQIFVLKEKFDVVTGLKAAKKYGYKSPYVDNPKYKIDTTKLTLELITQTDGFAVIGENSSALFKTWFCNKKIQIQDSTILFKYVNPKVKPKSGKYSKQDTSKIYTFLDCSQAIRNCSTIQKYITSTGDELLLDFDQDDVSNNYTLLSENRDFHPSNQMGCIAYLHYLGLIEKQWGNQKVQACLFELYGQDSSEGVVDVLGFLPGKGIIWVGEEDTPVKGVHFFRKINK